MSKTPNPAWMITGAAGTLGRAMAEAAARQGATLVLLDRDRSGLERVADAIESATGEPPYLYPLDLAGAGPEDYETLAERTGKVCSQLDLLVHGAADFRELRPLNHTEPEAWLAALQAGLTGPLWLTRALLPILKPGPAGRVVWLVDTRARDRALWGAYGLSQSGRQAIAGMLTDELGPRGPNMQCIDPGPFRGPLRARAWPAEDPARLDDPATVAERLVGEWLNGMAVSVPANNQEAGNVREDPV